MHKILLGLTVVFLLGAAGLSFITKSKIDGLQAEKAAAEDRSRGTETALSTAKTELTTAQEEAAAATSKAEAAERELATAKEEIEKGRTEVTRLQTSISEKDKEVETLKEELRVAAAGGTDGVAAPEVAELQEKLQKAEAELAEQQQIAKTFESKIESAERRAEELAERERKRQAQFAAKSFEGEVLAFNPGWNFVVLSIGDKHGVAMNAELIVKRGDTMLGRVRVTSVEPNTSIADVVPGSVPRGASIRPGDRVIYPGAGA